MKKREKKHGKRLPIGGIVLGIISGVAVASLVWWLATLEVPTPPIHPPDAMGVGRGSW